MQEHTSQQYEEELTQLKDMLLAMGGRCEQMIEQAIRALLSQDAVLAKKVLDADKKNNADELMVDDMAIRILALRQPVGRDLRFTIAAVKVVTDLERIGDESVNLAERAQEMSEKSTLPGPSDKLPLMAQLAGRMLHDALDSFVEEDALKARAVFKQDDAVDEMYGEILRGCADFMKDNSERIGSGMRISNCAKYLERIGDHATNIAEMVIFLVDGVDVRHSKAKYE